MVLEEVRDVTGTLLRIKKKMPNIMCNIGMMFITFKPNENVRVAGSEVTLVRRTIEKERADLVRFVHFI